ncbi:phosphotransferase family protein [Actinorhabdospora filicis]|uniref:phosphotransferase family protein n=1 Tax=Actinorhabdospora filicis TaxID=1785913 RepID=UPI0025557B94|nr:aminoglycoside phosphotransferase family protein [Actinorhabdospora filicis]
MTRAGQVAIAHREVAVAGWLAASGVPAVRPADLPVSIVGEHAVTWWQDLGPHARGDLNDLADLLRRLHALPIPADLDLPPLAPFTRLLDRIEAAELLPEDGRAWLLDRAAELREAYQALPDGLAACVVHGDAWRGNVAVTTEGPVLLDLERTTVGPPEWDLASVGVSHTTSGLLSHTEWTAFCEAYGHDVLDWPGYPVLAGIRELRRTTFAWQAASSGPEALAEARLRLECLQGRHGPRPWPWASLG